MSEYHVIVLTVILGTIVACWVGWKVSCILEHFDAPPPPPE